MATSALKPLPDNWKFLDLKQILESPAPKEPPWKIRNLVAAGCGTQVSAHPHGMKSFTWLQASIEAAIGQKVWNHFPVSGVKRTLFLETEDPEWLLAQRVQKIARGLGITAGDVKDAGCFVLGCLGPFDLVGMSGLFKSAIERYQPDFTVLSTLQGLLAGRDWTKQDDMGPVMSLMVDISSHYSPLISITHSPWDPKQKRAAGSITQAANFPTTCHYQKYVSKTGTHVNVNIDSKIGADPESCKFKLKLMDVGDGLRMAYEHTASTEEIEEHIRLHPGERPVDMAGMFGISEKWARTLRKRTLGK